jgi:predicted permease
MNTLAQDLRYAFRALAKNRGFAIAAILSLAIGIGANTAIFSVANALLLSPLPYRDPQRLVILWNRSPGLNIMQDWFSTAQYFDIKSGHDGFEQVAIAIGANYNLTGTGEPERVGIIRASSNMLPMLGAKPLWGRLFVETEDSLGRTPTAVLTYGMWARTYGRDPHIIGKPILLNGNSYEIIGVLPQTFSLPREVLPTLYGAERPDVFLPLPLGPDASRIREHEDFNIIGKLKPGVLVSQAQAEMDTITARLRHDYPESYPPNGGLTFGIVPLQEQVVGDVRLSLLVLLSTVGFVLLIACANVANLLLSRAVARQGEIAVRTALGASPARIVRQLLTESIALALCGGTIGVTLAFWAMDWIRVLGTKSIPRLQDVSIDGRVLLFALLLSVLSGIVFGLAPAMRVSSLDLHSTLKDAGRSSAGTSAMWGRGNSVRRLLVISELALSVMLLIGAGLLIRSFSHLQGVAPGFNPQNVLTFELTMSGRKYSNGPAILSTYHELWEHLGNMPGVSAAGGTTALPLSEAFSWTPITIEGRIPPAGEKFLNADERLVGGNYFQAMEIPLRGGRLFNEQDTIGKPTVVVIDERMAREFWPNEDPVGKRIHIVELGPEDPWQTIIGVVGRVKHESLDSDPRIAFYTSQAQFPVRAMTVVVQSKTDPAALASAVKNTIRGIDPDLPIYSVETMSAHVNESLARRRFSVLLLTLFAGLALALAAIGIYGVMAYIVSQGTREIGIRMALGATPRHILNLVVRQAMTLALFGVAIGLLGAFALSRLLQDLLFGVRATDPATYAFVPFVLILVALTATYIPARRAARIDPMISLRCD